MAHQPRTKHSVVWNVENGTEGNEKLDSDIICYWLSRWGNDSPYHEFEHISIDGIEMHKDTWQGQLLLMGIQCEYQESLE